VMPWSPLARGFLSGKYRRGESPPADTRFRRGDVWMDEWQRWDNDRNWRIVDAVGQIAQARGKTHAQVALNWLLRQPAVTSPIIGATSLQHLNQNLGSLGWELTSEEIERLDEASFFDVGYPYDFITQLHRDR
jgi:aryl-alcohol dehydrogenase-like predicted oxidoreductase